MLNILIIILLILIIINNDKFYEGFTTFFEPSDNYNLINKVWYYNSLRNTVGCSNYDNRIQYNVQPYSPPI